jgi:hypothetical protein
MGATDAQEMQEVVKQRFVLWRQVVQAGDFVRGSVVVLRRPCTYKGCRLCWEGQRHPATYLSLKEKGRTRLIYLPKGLTAQAKAWVAEWRRLEELLGQMSRTNARMLRLLAHRQGRQGRRKP